MNEAVCFCYFWNKLKAWNQNCKVPTRIVCLKLGTHHFILWSYAKSKYFKVLFFFSGRNVWVGKSVSLLHSQTHQLFVQWPSIAIPCYTGDSDLLALLYRFTQSWHSVMWWWTVCVLPDLSKNSGGIWTWCSYLCSLTIPFYIASEQMSSLKNWLPTTEHRKGEKNRNQIGKSQIKTMSL